MTDEELLEQLLRRPVAQRTEFLTRSGSTSTACLRITKWVEEIDRLTGGPFHEGRIIGDRYELVGKEPLGVGRFAEVWRARDRELNRDVALKLFAQQLSWNQMRRTTERMRAEATRLAQVDSPHVIKVLEGLVRLLITRRA